MGVKKKKKIPMYYKNSYLCTRIAIRFFLYAFINFCALQATINVASNALYNWDIHLISSSVARSTSDRSSWPSRVRSSLHVPSSSVRASFSISASAESHRVFFVTTLPKISKHFFLRKIFRSDHNLIQICAAASSQKIYNIIRFSKIRSKQTIL